MFNAILTFLGGPVIKGLLDYNMKKLEQDGNLSTKAMELAAKEIELQAKEAEINNTFKTSLIGKPWEPINLMGYAVAFYFAKVLVWDAALHMGSTDAVGGQVGEWAGMYMAFYLGKRGIENVVRIIRR
jgi:hypothetical protein